MTLSCNLACDSRKVESFLRMLPNGGAGTEGAQLCVLDPHWHVTAGRWSLFGSFDLVCTSYCRLAIQA